MMNKNDYILNHGMIFFLYWLWFIILFCIVVCISELIENLPWKSGVILIGLPLFGDLMFCLATFNILSLLCTFSVLIITYHRKFIFWLCWFSVLYATYTLIGSSCFRLGEFSSMVLLKKYSCVFVLGFSSFFYSYYS